MLSDKHINLLKFMQCR